MTEPGIIAVDPQNPSGDATDKAVELLLYDKLVVAPTETLYGLLARADHETALDRVYQAKRRDSSMPLSVFVNDIETMKQYATVPVAALRLAERFLPGPITLVLSVWSDVSVSFARAGTVGFRVSSSPLIRELVRKTGIPLVATSANLSGAEVPTTIGAVSDILGDAVALYLDGGPLSGRPSTVIRCVGDSIEVLREGAVPATEIRQVVGGRSVG